MLQKTIFFFQAEDGIRDLTVTGVQTCALPIWRIQINGNLTGIFADYHYVGTGDVGGSPNENSVKLMEAITTRNRASLPQVFPFGAQPAQPGPPVQVGDGPVRVIWSKADQMFQYILNCCSTDRLPRYKGDLELINHYVGSITSEAYQKRCMRKNELLADAAEKASLGAEWLGARAYPRDRLNGAWTLVMGGQFFFFQAEDGIRDLNVTGVQTCALPI